MVVIDAGESLVIERRSRHAFAETESLPSRSISALRANPKGGMVLMNAHPHMAPEPPLKLAHAPASKFAMRYQAADTTQLIGAMDLPLECLSKSVL